MTQAQDYVIDTGHGQVAEGVWELFAKCGGYKAELGGWVDPWFLPTGQLITGAGL